MGCKVDTRIEIRIFWFDTMMNYQLFQNVKLLENCKFNNLTIILITTLQKNVYKKYMKQLDELQLIQLKGLPYG